MQTTGPITAIVFAALALSIAEASAFDDALYPNLKGQWRSVGGPMRFDPAKPWGPGQQAPLTPEYQALFDANLIAQAEGRQGETPTYTCLSPGMPRVTNGYGQIEFVITPDTTHILVQHIHDNRRIYTDGRDWSAAREATFLGYSIGKWVDTDGNGKYNVLEVETRLLKGPRVYDNTGLMLHPDNQSVIKERIYLSKTEPNLLIDEITVTDNALTRPWKVLKSYKRDPSPQPYWREDVCAEGNSHVFIHGENYMLSADGELMPAKKGQQPPDLRYFNQAKQ